MVGTPHFFSSTLRWDPRSHPQRLGRESSLLCGITAVWARHMDNNIFTQIGFVVLWARLFSSPAPVIEVQPIYFFIFDFVVRAVAPYRLLKHLRHLRSRRSMKLGARSSLPQ